MIDTGLAGRTAIVTGANHGIGAATAQALAAQGASVFVHYLRWRGDLSQLGSPGAGGEALYRSRQAAPPDELIASIRANGGRAEAWEADLSDPSTIPQLFDRVEDAFGPVEVLINNAAHCRSDSFLPESVGGRDLYGEALPSVTAATHDNHFAINSRAVALTMAEFARRHIEREANWGRIINISTDAAATFPHEVSYGASKYALESYSRSAAVELGRYGVTVNVVSPGPIQTGYITPKAEETLIWRIPLTRLGVPEDVADVIAFLTSEQARWLTGQLLYVGGGHRMG
ncbi:MAG: SDR family oxidoreductase [Dehalococcoidia bacterium]